MPVTPYDNAKRIVEALAPLEQLRLVAELVANLGGKPGGQPRSLLELEGLGREVWQGVDVDEYLHRERLSWNG